MKTARMVSLGLSLGVAGCDSTEARPVQNTSTPKMATCIAPDGDRSEVHCWDESSGGYMSVTFGADNNLAIHTQTIAKAPIQALDLNIVPTRDGLRAWMDSTSIPAPHQVDLNVTENGQIRDEQQFGVPKITPATGECQFSGQNAPVIEVTCPVDGDSEGMKALVFASSLGVEVETSVARQAARLSFTRLMSDIGGEPVFILSTHQDLSDAEYLDVITPRIIQDADTVSKLAKKDGSRTAQVNP